MLEQRVGPSVRHAAQLSIFVEGKVPAPSNPFRFSKRRDGISLESLEFFAHDEAIDVRTHAERCNRTAVLRPSFVFHSLVDCGTRVFHAEDTADHSEIPWTGGARVGRDDSEIGGDRGISRQKQKGGPTNEPPWLKYFRFLLLVVDLDVMLFCAGCSSAGRVNGRYLSIL
jgi:hypothetical protein